MSVDELERGLKEKEKELNRILDKEKYLRTEQKELLTRFGEEKALGIKNMKKYMQD